MKIEPPFTACREYRQTLDAPPDAVFPLLCPVREREWVVGWDPHVVVTASGVIEPGCIFVTPGDDGLDSIWVTTRHDPRERLVEFVKVTPGSTVGRIAIRLEAAAEGRTHAHVSYAYTALSGAGREFVEEFTEERFERFMRAWEDALNAFLHERGHGGMHDGAEDGGA